MSRFRALGVLCGVLGASLLNAGELATYRSFQFGMNLSAAAKQAGLEASEARIIHQRPAVMQEIDWQPSGFLTSRDADPIRDGLLCFYKDQLFRIVVTYDRNRVEGMTADDMIAAISTTTGLRSDLKLRSPPLQLR